MPSRKSELTMRAVAGIGLACRREAGRVRRPSADHRDARQAVLAGEVEVALVVRRAAEDARRCRIPSARSWRRRPAVRARDRTDAAPAGRCRSRASRPSRSPPRVVPMLRHSAMKAASRGSFRAELGGERMLGRDRHEAGAEDRVGPGGEDLRAARRPARSRCEAPCAGPRAGRSSSPASAGPCRASAPASSSAVEQLVGEVGDAEEPLGQLAPLDRRARAPALAVDHLLVGEHGLVDRVPVDPRLPCGRPGRRSGSRGTASARWR